MPRKTKFGGDPPVPQKVHFKAKNSDKRYDNWLEAVMIRGSKGLPDPFEATRRLDAMGDEYLCPDCDTKLTFVSGTEYRCQRCKDDWFVTLLPLTPEFPSWPGKEHWKELKERLQTSRKKSRRNK